MAIHPLRRRRTHHCHLRSSSPSSCCYRVEGPWQRRAGACRRRGVGYGVGYGGGTGGGSAAGAGPRKRRRRRRRRSRLLLTGMLLVVVGASLSLGGGAVSHSVLVELRRLLMRVSTLAPAAAAERRGAASPVLQPRALLLLQVVVEKGVSRHSMALACKLDRLRRAQTRRRRRSIAQAAVTRRYRCYYRTKIFHSPNQSDRFSLTPSAPIGGTRYGAAAGSRGAAGYGGARAVQEGLGSAPAKRQQLDGERRPRGLCVKQSDPLWRARVQAVIDECEGAELLMQKDMPGMTANVSRRPACACTSHPPIHLSHHS